MSTKRSINAIEYLYFDTIPLKVIWFRIMVVAKLYKSEGFNNRNLQSQE
jgi:hypothetical protein